MNKYKVAIGVLVVVIVALASYIVFGKTAYAPLQQPVVVEKQVVPTPAEKQTEKQIKVYAEKDTGAERILGSSGEQMRLVAESNFPATVTYTYKYSSAVVYPGAVAKEQTFTETISVKPGKTILREFNAIDGTVDVHFTYVDNSNKTPTQVTPAVKANTTLRLEGVASNADQFLNSSVRHYNLIANSNSKASVTYTLIYTPPATSAGASAQQQSTTKTIFVPPGQTTIENITTTTEPSLTYTVK